MMMAYLAIGCLVDSLCSRCAKEATCEILDDVYENIKREEVSLRDTTCKDFEAIKEAATNT